MALPFFKSKWFTGLTIGFLVGKYEASFTLPVEEYALSDSPELMLWCEVWSPSVSVALKGARSLAKVLSDSWEAFRDRLGGGITYRSCLSSSAGFNYTTRSLCYTHLLYSQSATIKMAVIEGMRTMRSHEISDIIVTADDVRLNSSDIWAHAEIDY